jgi:hypothetical protein
VKVIALATLLPVAAVLSCAAQSSYLSPVAVAVKVMQYRRMSEQTIVGELKSLLAIPNTANDEINIRRNATTCLRGPQTARRSRS